MSIREHEIFKAVSEPIRLRIMVLLTRQELCVCDLTTTLRLPQSTVSRHLCRLKQAGLIVDRRAGKWVHYRLVDSPDQFTNSLAGLLRGLGDRSPYKTDLENLRLSLKKKNC